MLVEIDIPDSRLNDLIIQALDDGIHYWATAIDLFDNEVNPQQTYNKTDKPIENLSSIQLRERDTGAVHGLSFSTLSRNGEWRVRNFWRLKRGLEVMARHHIQHLANIIADDWDSETADVFIQCCLFGEIRYG